LALERGRQRRRAPPQSRLRSKQAKDFAMASAAPRCFRAEGKTLRASLDAPIYGFKRLAGGGGLSSPGSVSGYVPGMSKAGARPLRVKLRFHFPKIRPSFCGRTIRVPRTTRRYRNGERDSGIG